MTLDIGIADALAGALVPVGNARTAKTRPEFYLDVVVKSGLDVSVADAITGGDLERTMEGASTLTLTLHDPHRALLRNPDLAKAIDMSFGGYWWRLVKIAKSGDALTLTFEDRDVAYLRQHVKARKAYRGTVTRAQFIRQLVREVGQRPAKKGRKPTWNTKRITFVCPELSMVQPIGDDSTGGGNTAGKKTSALYVGDSLAVGTIPQVRNQIPKTPLTGDGQVGRTSSQALDVVKAKLTPAHTTVVFDAGTNDDPTKPSAYRAILDAVKAAIGNRRLVVATLNRGNADVSAMNATVRDFAHDTGATLVDWGSLGDAYLGGDGTHPTPAGYVYRGKLMATAIGRGPKSKAPAKRHEDTREENKQPGINSKANLTVKGAKATSEQRRNGERVLDIADELHAGPKATKALMEAVIVESQIRNLSYGDKDSIGILQLRTSLHGVANAKSIEKSVHLFLTQGFTGLGGAIKLARQHSGWSAGDVAQGVQGSQPAEYNNWAAEADKWLDAYGGASGSDTGGTADRGSSRAKKKYAFRRGEPGKPEDSWTAIQRLAEEVQWRAFMDRGRLYYVSDDWLRRQKPRFVISEADDGIDEINFDIDSGKVTSDVTVTAHAKTFQVPVGCTVQIKECGIANGRYLAKSVHQSIYDTACEITLTAPTPKLAEPEAEDATPARGAQGGDGSSSAASGSLRDRIVAVAQASAASYRKHPGAWFYSQGGSWGTADPTKPPPRGTRSDCSQWVAAVYKKAGAPAPGPNYNGIYTGNMNVRGRLVPTSHAKPGDIILYGFGASSHHVELYVGPGSKTIGHGSPPVDTGSINMISDAHCWRYDFLD